MKKTLHRLGTLLIVLSFCLCTSAKATAVQPTLNGTQESALNSALSGIESQKEFFNLSQVDFTNLSIGHPIQTYIYQDNSFEQGFLLYPIMNNGQLALFAIENEGDFQLTTALVNEISQLVDGSDPFAIVYDRNSSYLYTNGSFILLGTSNLTDDSRSSLTGTAVNSRIQLDTTSLSETIDFEYVPVTPASTYAYYECDVEYVTQNPPSNICWAASIASIVNYCNGGYLSAVDVAKAYYGSNYNNSLDITKVPGILASYNLSYTRVGGVPTESVISSDIRNGYPLYARFRVSNGNGHACVLYGIDTTNSKVYVMDPEFGFATVNKSAGGTYSYVSGRSGVSLTLIDAVRHK